MKLVLSVLMFSLVAFANSANAAKKSSCDKKRLEVELQDMLDKKQEKYTSKQFVSLSYTQTIPSGGRDMIVAGAEDVTYINEESVAVDVFTMVTKDLVARSFFAIIVNSQTCKIVDTALVAAYDED